MNTKTRTAWIFLAPMLIVLLMVAAWPLGRTIWFSFTDANINDPAIAQFVGFDNYFGEYGLFFNPNNTDGFWASDWGIAIRNTLFFSVVSSHARNAFRAGRGAAAEPGVQRPHLRARRGAGAVGDTDDRLGQDMGLDAATTSSA